MGTPPSLLLILLSLLLLLLSLLLLPLLSLLLLPLMLLVSAATCHGEQEATDEMRRSKVVAPPLHGFDGRGV